MAIVRKRNKTPSSVGKKYLVLVFIVFSVLLAHKNLSGSTHEEEDENSKSEHMKEVSFHGEITEGIDKIVINEFEETFEQEEEEREHLDLALDSAKFSMDLLEDSAVEEMGKELIQLMNFKEDDIKEKVSTYLMKRNGSIDENTLNLLIERVQTTVNEENRLEFHMDAEDITMEGEQILEEIVLEDVIIGKESLEIEVDVEREKDLLEEDMIEELEEALLTIIDHVDETIERVEDEILSEYDAEAPQPEVTEALPEVIENEEIIEGNEEQTEVTENGEKNNDLEDEE